MALAVFEDLQLTEFGNRIPAITFELLADEGEPTIGAILNDAGGGAIRCDVPETVVGYAAYGSTRRAAIAALVEPFAIPLFDAGEQLVTQQEAVFSIEEYECGCGPGDESASLRERGQMPAGDLPKAVTLGYYDPARDYQSGQMRAGAGSSGGMEEAIELPAVLTADRAKALADSSIARRWAERDKLVLRLPVDRMSVEPGQVVQLEDGSTWRVDTAVIEELVVRLELSRQSTAVASAMADSGRYLSAPDTVTEPTTLVVLDLPNLGLGRHDVPALQVAACQVGASWRPVPLEVTVGAEVRTLSTAPAEAVIGTTLNSLGDGDSLDVELADPAHWLESRDAGALSNGANLAAVGSEIIQFGGAVPIGRVAFG